MLLDRQKIALYKPDAGAGDGGPEKPAGATPDDKKPETLTFTQAQLDALFADRARRGEESATAKLLEKFGAKTPDEIASQLAEFQKIKASTQTEQEKTAAKIKQLEDALAAATQEKEAALAQATERLMRAAVVQAATERGFRSEAVNDVWLVVDRASIKLDGENFSGVKESVEAVAKSKPFWLQEKNNNPPPRGTPPPRGQQPPAQPAQPNTDKTPPLRL